MKRYIAFTVCLITVLLFTLSSAACSGARIKLINISLAEHDYAVAVSKDDPQLKSQINSILEELLSTGVETEDGKVTFKDIYDEETEAVKSGNLIPVMPLRMSSSGDREREFIVASNVYAPPFSYIVDTSFGGVDIRIAKIIADRLGKELVVLYTDYADLLTSVQNGTADAAISATAISDEGNDKVDFSIPYYSTHLQIAVATGDSTFNGLSKKAEVESVLNNLDGVKAGATLSRPGYVYLSDGFKEIDTTAYNTIIVAIRALANGEISIVCGDRDLLLSAINSIS